MALPRSPIADLCTSLAAGALALGLAAAPAAAGTSALVVGVDDYSDSTALNDLKGAVADARDIAGALESLDVAPIELLLDDRASRPTVFAAWDRLIADAAAGDTIVVFFAGHGGQLAEARPGEEDDGLDEIFMLGDFDPEDSHSLILDNEFYGWWQQAAAKAVDIVFIADTCHSGGLDRTLRTRWGGTYDVSADDIPDLPAEDPDAPLPHVTRVLAALEHQVIPELLFEGEGWRGALSYVLGHGLRGAADLDRDGAIRRSELRRYVVDQVRHEAGARHRPDVRPLEGPDPVLFGAAAGPSTGAGPAACATPRDALRAGDVGIRVVDGILPPLPDAAAVTDPDAPHALVWDGGQGLLARPEGEPVLQLAPGTPPAELRARLAPLVDRERARRALTELSRCRSLALAIEPLDETDTPLPPEERVQGVLPFGQAFGLAVEAGAGAHLTVFNLASSGAVQMLYPILEKDETTDAPWGPENTVVRCPFAEHSDGFCATPEMHWLFRDGDAGEPAGEDLVVAVAAPQDLSQLADELTRLARTDDNRAWQAVERVVEAAERQEIGIGLHRVFTAAVASAASP